MLYLQPSVPAIAEKSTLATRPQKKVNQKVVDKEVVVKKKGGKEGGRVAIDQNISNGSMEISIQVSKFVVHTHTCSCSTIPLYFISP